MAFCAFAKVPGPFFFRSRTFGTFGTLNPDRFPADSTHSKSLKKSQKRKVPKLL